VAGSVTSDLLGTDMEFPCPRCGYAIWAQWVQVAAQAAVLCPCCRVRVLLRDPTGSVQLAGERMQRALDTLAQALKGPGG
jgi:DNA-directed RNA polymerase subunit RPC12/RpoP